MMRPTLAPPLTRPERMLALVDLTLGILTLSAALFGIASAFWSASPHNDTAFTGLILGVLLVPFGLAALAAFDAVRQRAAGRWFLQLLTAVPIALITYVMAGR